MRALLLENIHPSATEGFARAGIEVETRPGSLSEDELVATLPGFDLLGIRSNTFLTDRALAAATDLVAVGASASAPTRSTSRRRRAGAWPRSTRRTPTRGAWSSS